MNTIIKPPFATGCMPNTDFQYEEFEGFLASYYLTYFHFSTSSKKDEVSKFVELNEILTRFALRHNVQVPKDAVENVRAKEDWGQPHKHTYYFSVKDSFRAFLSDFGLIDKETDRPDIEALWKILNEPLFLF